ncbi:acyltransferase [Mucilaginibacter pedocola]|uniref:Acetyltransferase n=1 Tax=Mucilaginibacter pedocola TaxID=1792845 RepID=A0A1S9PFV6_9SPHI|nr:acyltransferase [Mucilaginibacter pedocola]OOQ59468.1 acetyltransferase [Mucilaginibacter pedocola]
MKKLASLYYYLFSYWCYKLMLGALGHKARIYRGLKLDGGKNIFIGNNVYIGRLSWLAASPLTNKQNCKLVINEGAYIGNFAHIYSTSSITIGKKALLADKVYITDNLHGYDDITLPYIEQPIKQLKPVLIGEGCWIGENVCIIGANVGKQSIIGANAVVTKDIPDYCVAVGSPARIIKRYCEQEKIWKKTTPEGVFIN